jgi:hypothetical protein
MKAPAVLLVREHFQVRWVAGSSPAMTVERLGNLAI